MKMNKRITDLTDKEIKEFFRSLNDAEEVLSISKDETWNEITCQIRSYYRLTFDSDPVYVESKLILTDPKHKKRDNESLYSQYGKEALEKWMQFCFAKGIYPDWMLNNPYTKAHVVQLTDEQLELIKTDLDFVQTKIIERDGEGEWCQETFDLLNYLKQFGDKNL